MEKYLPQIKGNIVWCLILHYFLLPVATMYFEFWYFVSKYMYFIYMYR